MIRINLLPHREEKRRQRRQQFYLLAGAMVVLGALIGVLVSTIIGGFIESQEDKNNFLKTEIAKLDKDIAEIKISADKAGRRARRLDNFDFEELEAEAQSRVVPLEKPLR